MSYTTNAVHHGLSEQVVCLDRGNYNHMRNIILKQLAVYGPMTLVQLSTAVEKRLRGKFEGSIPLYFTTVELDLEALGEVRYAPGSNHHLVELA
jgi:hypothetical protein